MGKIFKGALLGAVSALGAYYYKNPKELEKHKELLKENTKTGIEKLTAIINEKTQELEARTQEEQDLAKEKLEELTNMPARNTTLRIYPKRWKSCSTR